MKSKKNRPSRQGISRRDFLKSMGGTLVGSAVLTTGGILGEEAVASILKSSVITYSGKTTVKFRINGEVREASIETRTTLLDVLRDQFELTGTKEVCDRGHCGACTVLLDGKPVLSCMLLAVDVRNREITTVEGLSGGKNLTPVQQAFVDKDGLMCGFCTPGFVMSATALLRKNPSPTLEEIKAGLSGNLCRCGTYPKVFEAVQAAAQRIKRGGQSL